MFKWFFQKRSTHQAGLSLLEVVIGIAVIGLMSLVVFQGYQQILTTTKLLRTRTIATNIANEQIEIIRNLPYADIGTVGGVPEGVLLSTKTISREGIDFDVTTTVKNIDQPFDGVAGGIPDDTSPADNKLIEIQVDCDSCNNFNSLILNTYVAPESLESLSLNGVLLITVFNADGVELSGADITVVNTSVSPQINLTDVSGSDGTLTIVDAPPSIEGYEITVTGTGYSTDQTYTADTENPNPLKTHSTVNQGVVTLVSFAIDQLSTITVESVTSTCGAVPTFDFNLTSDKLIGVSPDVYKYDESLTTDTLGELELSDMEWGTYTLVSNDNTYDVVGISPTQPLVVLPGIDDILQLTVGSHTPATWLFNVIDDNTQVAVDNATVRVQKTGYDVTRTVGEATIEQTDWSGGSGQSNYLDGDRYQSQDGNIDDLSSPGSITLLQSASVYPLSGELTSSTFDLGSGAEYNDIIWEETLPTGTDVRFQVATSSSGAPLDFIGPDGTDATYYTSSNASLHSSHDGDRYIRYKAFLSTTDNLVTPVLENVSISFSGDCVVPGQTAFQGLTQDEYTITVDASGYDQFITTETLSADWQYNDLSITPTP